MGRGEELLAAVIADPDDDAPRLVYADWLAERGDPRGELIAVQCRIARAAEDDPDRPVLLAREKQLMAAHRRTWEAPVEALGAIVERWRRGFVMSVRARTVEEFVDGAAALCALTPLEQLRVNTSLGWSGLERMQLLAGCRQLARLRYLELDRCEVDDSTAPYLFASPHLSGLWTLDVSFNRLGPSSARALAAAPALGQLAALMITGSPGGNRIGDGGLAAIAGSTALPQLISLLVTANGIGPGGAAALAASRLPALSGVILDENELGDEGAIALAGAKAGRWNMLSIDGVPGGAVSIGNRGAEALAGSDACAELRILHLRYNSIGDRGARAFAASPRLAHLETLDVRDNVIGDEGAQAIIDSPYLRGVTSFGLSGNQLDLGKPLGPDLATDAPGRDLDEAAVARWRARFGRDVEIR